MGGAERLFQCADDPVGQVGGRGIAFFGGGLHGLLIDGQIAHHAGQCGQRQFQRIGGSEGRLLVFLQILGIGERQALHHNEQPGEGAQDASHLGARQFRRIGIALLRHDRGAGGKRIRQPDEAVSGRGPKHEFFGQPRQVAGRDGAGGEEFQREIARRDGVERIPHRARKSPIASPSCRGRCR